MHGPEEVQHDAHVEDHRRVHRRGHLEQSPAATASVGGTPNLDRDILLSLPISGLWLPVSDSAVARFQVFSQF